MPTPIITPDLNWLRSTPVAHRGLHDAAKGIPENTCLAFEHAIAQGYGVELDVQWLGDDTPVVFHDDSLDRMTKCYGPLADYTWSQLKDVTIGGSKETLPLLSQVLDLINGRAPILIELKLNHVRRVKAKVDQVVSLLKDYAGPVAIQSFNPLVGQYLKRTHPHIIRGSLRTQYLPYQAGCGYAPHIAWSIVAMHALKIEAAHYLAWDAKFLYPLLARNVREFRDQPLLSWTVTSPEDTKRLKDMGVDNIIFEAFAP